MGRRLAVTLALAVLASATPAVAQTPEALRREIEQMKQQFEALQQGHKAALEGLSERIRQLEARPAPAAPQPPAPAAPTTAQLAPPPATPAEIIRPREPFSLYERRGAGQLLFDIGIVSDFVGNLTQRNVDRADAGTFFGRENRFFPREIEINMYGRIDPYAQGQVRFEFAEEFEDGARATGAKLAEAHLTLLTLPYGFQARIGQIPVRFGLLSAGHREALPQSDVPNVLLRFFGEEQFRDSGIEVTWVAPLPFYLEALAGIFNGDVEPAFGRGSLKSPMALGRLRTFLDLGDTSALQVGVSAAAGQTPERRRQMFVGYDVKYKLTPEAWRHPLLTLASEGIRSSRRVEVLGDPDGDGVDQGELRTRERFGWYGYAEVQPWKRWAGGLRYDSTQLLEAPGREWAFEPYLTFLASDFLRFRLGYKHTERDRRDAFSGNGATARTVDELFVQATFFLGAHAPHPF